MTQHEINSLIRPYLKRKQADRDRNLAMTILAAMIVTLFLLSFTLIVGFILNS
jgi:hypothetical protein